MDRKKLAMLAVTITTVAAGSLYAQSERKSDAPEAEKDQQQILVGSSKEKPGGSITVELEGLPVTTLTGEKVGEMQGITVDEQTRRIQFFSFTPHSEAGEAAAVLLPYGSLRLENDRAVILVPTAKVSSAPAQMGRSAEQYVEELQSHYGIAPIWNGEGAEEPPHHSRKSRDQQKQ